MKLLVLSDSHHSMRYMQAAAEQEHPNHIIHLGDHIRDAEALRQLYQTTPVLMVKGNCDMESWEREQVLTEFQNIRFLITHGHRYGVKSDLLRLSLAAMENQAKVVLFGHTHLAFCQKKDGVWFLNPGSCGPTSKPSYGIVELSGDKIDCRVVYF